jgi:predicted DNA-binding protein (UPF0251 family)
MAPHFSGFDAIGIPDEASTIFLNLEEYEALKLSDYELLTQAEASEIMNVSRPTFTRIYESARRKIAKALVEGCNIRFEGGNTSIVNWFKCSKCKIAFTITESSGTTCPICKSPSSI